MKTLTHSLYTDWSTRSSDDLPALYGKGDHQEDAGAVGEVADALQQRRDEVYVSGVCRELQVEGHHHQVGAEEENVSTAETREEIIEDTPRQPAQDNGPSTEYINHILNRNF